MSVASDKLVETARNGNYIGIPYSRLDCQAFIEKVLSDSGYTYNWRGSNHIWRAAVHDREPITDVNSIPAGAAVFTIKSDGGEKARGYNDDMKNAAHIGLYLGNGDVIHSSTGGVQMDKATNKRWTHYALFNCVDYSQKNVVRQCGRNCPDCWRG